MTATTTTSPLPSLAHAAGVAPGLRLVGVSKSFGHQTVLTGLDLSAYPGRVYGLLGLNGAGKSTAFNIALGLLTPDAGRVEIQGAPFSRRSLAQVGASINGPALFPQLSARRNLLVHCRLTGTSPQAIAPLLERVGLAGVGRKRAGSFSTGMKVRRLRVSSARTSSHRPTLTFTVPCAFTRVCGCTTVLMRAPPSGQGVRFR